MDLASVVCHMCANVSSGARVAVRSTRWGLVRLGSVSLPAERGDHFQRATRRRRARITARAAARLSIPFPHLFLRSRWDLSVAMASSPWAGARPPALTRHLLVVFFAVLAGRGGAAGGGGKGSSVYPAAVVYPHHSRQISWKPRVFLYQHFLSDDEANHLISLARAELKRSAVADNMSGKSTLSEVRTSSGTFLRKGQDPIVAGIEDKIAAWTFLPKENGEDIQVLRYKHGEKYEPHYDYFTDKVNTVRGGHRYATVLLYLTDVAEGGETVFPLAEFSNLSGFGIHNFGILHNAHATSAPVKPRKGDALLFFNLKPDGATDSVSLHGGCPVIKGEKWSATKWIRVASFDKVHHTPGNCTDENESCAKWAALGECIKNPEYMVGTAASPGYCRRSCNVC
ncbi:hypothetical protein HU200_031780 [Digitaria exilis]|uniref:procollagen-proline 4-dioxygenase n=1 Tax=Digitaria exilis TaxID=1010633 RepID=A0A835BLP0_9POAL|nr:hypothetical protein HU200_031780 [Digitaria exilis]